MHYRLKATDVIEAHQWFKNGDHPMDNSHMIVPDNPRDRHEAFLSEGAIVRRFRDPGFPGANTHGRCGQPYHDHGWIEPKLVHGMKTWEDGAMVCPSDYIISQRVWDGGRPQYSVVSAHSFEHTYEAVVDSRLVNQIAGLPDIYAASVWSQMGEDERNAVVEGTNGKGVLIMPDELLDRR